MSLALTPINDAWSHMTKPKEKKEKKITRQVVSSPPNNNMYSNPDIQNKILRELNLIEPFSEPEPEQIVPQNINNGLQFKSKELQDYFKPYSSEYIESIILNIMNKSNQSNYDINGLTETLENIYIIVLAILILIIFDIALRYKR